jgi:hypothetical protein
MCFLCRAVKAIATGGTRTKYIPSSDGGHVVPVYSQAHQAPATQVQPIINKPNQALLAGPQRPLPLGYAPIGLQRELRHKGTVQTIEVKQHDMILHTPLTPWNMGWKQPIDSGNQTRPLMPNLNAPDRVQSIPGYQVIQTQFTDNGQQMAQIYTNLKAPTQADITGNGCK